MSGLSLTPPTPLKIQLKQMAWELLQNVGRQKVGSRRAERGKRCCWQGRGSKAASLPEHPFLPRRAGGCKGSSVRRGAWKSGSCCRLNRGEQRLRTDPRVSLLPSPQLMHREDVPHFQILLMRPSSEAYLQMVPMLPGGILASQQDLQCGSSGYSGLRRTWGQAPQVR